MVNKKIEAAFNKQCNAELYSSYLYLSMAAYFESQNLKGFANWMRVQSQEEWGHGLKFFDHLSERGGRVTLSPIEAAPKKWESPLDTFKELYKHEQKVTGLIHNLVNLAEKEKDRPAQVLLQWFVSEQVQEEANALEIAEKLEPAKNAPGPLLMIDRALGERKAEAE